MKRAGLTWMVHEQALKRETRQGSETGEYMTAGCIEEVDPC